jgi:hypothetical protein
MLSLCVFVSKWNLTHHGRSANTPRADVHMYQLLPCAPSLLAWRRRQAGERAAVYMGRHWLRVPTERAANQPNALNAARWSSGGSCGMHGPMAPLPTAKRHSKTTQQPLET